MSQKGKLPTTPKVVAAPAAPIAPQSDTQKSSKSMNIRQRHLHNVDSDSSLPDIPIDQETLSDDGVDRRTTTAAHTAGLSTQQQPMSAPHQTKRTNSSNKQQERNTSSKKIYYNVDADESPLPRRPPGVEDNPSPRRQSTKPQRRRWALIAGLSAAVLIAALYVVDVYLSGRWRGGEQYRAAPASCVAGSEALQVVEYAREYPLVGAHLHMSQIEFGALVAQWQRQCASSRYRFFQLGSHLETPEELLGWLRKSSQAAAGGDVDVLVWTIGSIDQLGWGTRNALKALLETGAIYEQKVLGQGQRGLLVLRGDGDRVWLKSVVPHRTAHMFWTVSS